MGKKLAEKPKMEDKPKSDSNHSWTAQEKELFKSQYGCEILKQNCTLEEAKDKNVPNDAYIVTYEINGKIHYDLTRSSKRSSIFDMYYDNLGSVIRNIDWGYGRINPKLWGFSKPEKKKRKS
jgi:hypothetical protein